MKLSRYAPVSLDAELMGLTDADKGALEYILKAAVIMDGIYHLQTWYNNPSLRDWLDKNAEASEFDKLKWRYFLINKSPWSCIDENKPFLTSADSAIKLLPEATIPVAGWKGLQYRSAFPAQKPPCANFYPPDMDKKEFELWLESLTADQRQEASGFFNVIKRHSELDLDPSKCSNTAINTTLPHDLYVVPYSQEYKTFLVKAAELLHKAGDMTSTPSLKKLLHGKADAFLTNDYYESDIAWMELGVLPNSLIKSMYVSFLAGCFRSVRFGLEEAHGKGQALQFNWLFNNGAFVMHEDKTFSVDFDKVQGAVESLSREILTIQATGDKDAANELLQKYCLMTQPLKIALQKLEMVQVPIDIAPDFPIADKILQTSR